MSHVPFLSKARISSIIAAFYFGLFSASLTDLGMHSEDNVTQMIGHIVLYWVSGRRVSCTASVSFFS